MSNLTIASICLKFNSSNIETIRTKIDELKRVVF